MDIKLPEIGEGVTEGELIKYLVKVGDVIKADQPVAEVMTDKATVEVPSPSAGKVTALSAKEGQTIQVGGTLIQIEASGSASASTAPTQHTPTKPSTSVPMAAAPSGGGMDIYPPVAASHVLATPSTRRLAREMGVDVNRVSGTGLAGRVTRDDVLKGGGGATTSHTPAAAPSSMSIPRMAYTGPAGAVEERVALKGIRKKVAEKMQLSKHIIPHFTLMDEANVTDLVRMRTELKEKVAAQGIKITYLPFVMKALIATARNFAEVNASIDDAAQEIVYKKYFNIGFAADTPQGLVVPVIKNADHKSIAEISKEIVELSEKARASKLALEDLRGATMSITNIGSVGGTYATPIINHPEVLILGMYKISEKPIIKNGQLASIQVMNLTVTADHRLIDGAVAARFLKSMIEKLENPGLLMMDLM